MNALILRHSFWLVALLIALMSPTQALSAGPTGKTIHVPADYAKIQDAINAARDGDTVLIADGIYSGPGNRDIDFIGKNIVVKSLNGPAKAIIDCQGTSANQHRGFYFHNGEANAAEVDGFTIRNGFVHTPDDDGYPKGGGIDICSNSHATIKDCIVSHNTADDGGGGICAFRSNPIISNCVVIGNTAFGGGGICVLYGAGTISNCVVEGNTSSNYGGGIYAGNHTSDPNVTLNISIKNCTASNNTAEKGGGGIFASGNAGASGNVSITNCVVWANVNGLFGGEIYNYPVEPAPLIVTYSDIQGGYTGVGDINSDPQFVNAAAGDLHLKPGSPCLGQGTPDGAPATDLDGNPRPNPPSMGAYELAPSTITISDARLTIPQFINAGNGKYFLDEKVYFKGTGSGAVIGHWVVGGSNVSQVNAKPIDVSSGYWTEGSEIKLPWETIKASNFIIKFILDTPAAIQTPETFASVTGFRPDVNGWAFTNNVSTIYTIDFLHPLKFDGVCTGMVATARYYYHHQPLPSLLSIRRIRTDIHQAFNSGNDHINKVDVPRYSTYPSFSQDQWRTMNESEAMKVLPHLQNLDPTLLALFTADLSANHALLATAGFSSSSMLNVDNQDFGPSNIEEVRNAQDFAVYDPNFPNEFHEVYVGDVNSEARTVHFLSYTKTNGSNADSAYNLHYAGFGYFSYDYVP